MTQPVFYRSTVAVCVLILLMPFFFLSCGLGGGDSPVSIPDPGTGNGDIPPSESYMETEATINVATAAFMQEYSSSKSISKAYEALANQMKSMDTVVGVEYSEENGTINFVAELSNGALFVMPLSKSGFPPRIHPRQSC